jgi:dienelactone hydrolase
LKIFLVLSVFVLATAHAQERVVERAPTPFVEDGKSVSLEVVLYRPAGNGPFPLLVFNHGSTGRGNDRSLFTRTWTADGIAQLFNERGWLVAFPQRRGRGKSGGLYDEGFEWDRSRYACAPTQSLPGVERALQDIDAAYDWLVARADVDAKRVLIGGQSRGGILAVAYAGTRPGRVSGVLNFVGGWAGEGCSSAEHINQTTFARGAAFAGPTLWLYGDKDPFYGLPHSRKNFEAFTAAGGKGEFLVREPPPGRNGHSVLLNVEAWRGDVEAYLKAQPNRSKL